MFKDFSIFRLWRPSCLSEPQDFSYFGREPPRHHSYEVLITLAKRLRRS